MHNFLFRTEHQIVHWPAGGLCPYACRRARRRLKRVRPSFSPGALLQARESRGCGSVDVDRCRFAPLGKPPSLISESHRRLSEFAAETRMSD